MGCRQSCLGGADFQSRPSRAFVTMPSRLGQKNCGTSTKGPDAGAGDDLFAAKTTGGASSRCARSAVQRQASLGRPVPFTVPATCTIFVRPQIASAMTQKVARRSRPLNLLKKTNQTNSSSTASKTVTLMYQHLKL